MVIFPIAQWYICLCLEYFIDHKIPGTVKVIFRIIQFNINLNL